LFRLYTLKYTHRRAWRGAGGGGGGCLSTFKRRALLCYKFYQFDLIFVRLRYKDRFASRGCDINNRQFVKRNLYYVICFKVTFSTFLIAVLEGQMLICMLPPPPPVI
jgi:hypothetical protein